jgi:HSP20 family protein
MDSRQSATATTSTSGTDQARQQNVIQQTGQQSERNQRQEDQRDGQQQNGMARRTAPVFVNPFALLQRFLTEDISSVFGEPQSGKSRAGANGNGNADPLAFAPKIDVLQRGNELVVRADLPGVKPDDLTVEVSEDAITISGQRKEEVVEDSGNLYRVERRYGTFFREIPLPEGAIADQAKASCKDGVLEITVPAPPDQVSRGRRLEIAKSN